MNAGANQQLIATKLEPPAPIPKEPEKVNKPPEPPKPAPPAQPMARPPAGPPKAPAAPPTAPPKPEEKETKETQDGALLVPHDGVTGDGVSYDSGPEESIAKIHIDDEGVLKRIAEEEAKRAAEENNPDNPAGANASRKVVDQPPSLGGTLSANTKPPVDEPTSDPLSLPSVKGPTLNHADPAAQASPDVAAANTETKSDETLSALEQSVNSPHLREVDTKPTAQQPAQSPFPTNLVGPDTGLPPEQTAGSPNPSPPPPVPPPLTMSPPTKFAPGNMTDPNSGVPL